MSEKNKAEIGKFKLAIPVLKKLAFINFYKLLWKDWLFFSTPLIVTIAVGQTLSIVFTFFIPSQTSILQPSQILDIAKSLVAPIVTVNGLCIAIVPVISFFYLSEIREERRKMNEEMNEEQKKFSEPEDLKILKTASKYADAFWHNLRIGTMKYVRLFITLSLLSLITTISLYVLLIYVNPAFFLMIDVSLLIINLLGIAPIVKQALQQPALKLKADESVNYES